MTQKIVDILKDNKNLLVPLLIVILVVVIIYVVYKRKQYQKFNPLLLNKPYIFRKNNYKKKLIKSKEMPNICGLQYSLCFWM